MALHEDPRFNRAPFTLPAAVLESVLTAHRDGLNQSAWMYCGYAPLTAISGVASPATDVRTAVDNAFRLWPICGFERVHLAVTTGLRTSRFAAVLFWEVLHALAPGGLWIDIDESNRCEGTPLIAEDFPAREYFRTCLRPESKEACGPFTVQTFRKVSGSPLADHINDDGWTFGILTSGPSPRAAQMASAILAFDLPRVEVIFCGPRPAGVPADDRVRVMDLDRHEPRGWITRKKNVLAHAARYDNLCLLHDRFAITSDWVAALRAYGPCYSFLTLPQVFFSDVDRRFAQRYADYQVLYQSRDLDIALDSNVYAATHVFCTPYDDFYETSFCGGGLYVARRCLWNRVGQNEALYHGEREDVSFGLECQRRGMPHRVNRSLTVESLTPHPTTLTRVHDLVAPDTPVRGRLHVVPGQAEAAMATPERFKPIMAATRDAYYRHVVSRFNAIPGLGEVARIDGADVSDCRGLADFWRIVEQHLARVSFRTRADLTAVAFFLSDTMVNWPNCDVLASVRANERVRTAVNNLDGFDGVVGWGAGAYFRSAHRHIGRDLAFVVDSDSATWGSVIEGTEVRPPAALRDLDPHRTAVVVFSCDVDAITAAVRAIGRFAVFQVRDVLAERRLDPLSEMVSHFEEIERYYPVLFAEPSLGVAA